MSMIPGVSRHARQRAHQRLGGLDRETWEILKACVRSGEYYSRPGYSGAEVHSIPVTLGSGEEDVLEIVADRSRGSDAIIIITVLGKP